MGRPLDDRVTREEDAFGRRPLRTALKWSLGTIAVGAVLVAVIGALSFAFGWIGAGADIVGPDNVKAQYSAVIEDWNALETSAQNACAVTDAARSVDSPMLVEDPALAYAAQYRRIVVDFNRRQANIFEANLVGPGGYPKTAPTLAQMQERVC